MLRTARGVGQFSGRLEDDVMTDRLDVRQLISKVKRRPALWDPSFPGYWEGEARRRLWEEIVEELIGDKGATDGEKREFGNILQRRWRSLKGSYFREYQRLTKLRPDSGPLKSPYYYYNHLSFLEPIMTKNPSLSAEVVESDAPESPNVGENDSIKRGKRKLSPNRNRGKAGDMKDDDRLFLLSLLGPLKRIPEHLRLSVQVELLQVLQRAQNNTTVKYGQLPVLIYQNPHQPSSLSSTSSQTIQSSGAGEDEEEKHPLERYVIMPKLSPPPSPSSVNSLSDTELGLFQGSS